MKNRIQEPSISRIESFRKFSVLLLLLIIGVTGSSLAAQIPVTNRALEPQKEQANTGLFDNIEDDYHIKPGDVFFISIIGTEPIDMSIPVSLSGNLILHPLTSPIHIAGRSVTEAKEVIKTALYRYFSNVEISIELQSISPQRIHIFGAVNRPGEYVADSLITLFSGLKKAGGISPSGSKKITLRRQGEAYRYDLNNYLLYGRLEENPLLFNEDKIFVDFASSFAKVYVVTDSVNYAEHIELEQEMPLNLILKVLSKKYIHSNFQNLSVKRDAHYIEVDHNFRVKPGDIVYVRAEESYIYVRGNVHSPGRFNFVPGKTSQYYISLAGGVSRVGSSSRIDIVKEDGIKQKYNGQPLEKGDTIIIPLSRRTIIADYLTPISTVLSIFTTIIILAR